MPNVNLEYVKSVSAKAENMVQKITELLTQLEEEYNRINYESVTIEVTEYVSSSEWDYSDC